MKIVINKDELEHHIIELLKDIPGNRVLLDHPCRATTAQSYHRNHTLHQKESNASVVSYGHLLKRNICVRCTHPRDERQ